MRKLLYIESDPLTGRTYKDRFVEAGYHVEFTEDGATALLALARFKPDIVVANHMLSDMSGTEIVRRIRESEGSRTLPIVVFSKDYTTESVAANRRAGANRFVAQGRSTDHELFKALRESLTEFSQPTVQLESRPLAEPAPPLPGDSGVDTGCASALDASESPPDSSSRIAPQKDWVALAGLKVSAQALVQATEEQQQAALVRKITQDLESLADGLSSAGRPSMVRVAETAIRLLRDLGQHPETIQTSTTRTVSQTVDFLGVLLRNADLELEVAGKPFKVLAADDSVVARRAVMEALDMVSLPVISVCDGSEALQKTQGQVFDLFVLDVNMPGLGGFELCKALRTQAAHKETPVIFVTACNDFEHRLRFAQTGGDDFIAKPFLPSELAAKALRFLLNRRIHQAAAKHSVSPFFRQFLPRQ